MIVYRNKTQVGRLYEGIISIYLISYMFVYSVIYLFASIKIRF